MIFKQFRRDTKRLDGESHRMTKKVMFWELVKEKADQQEDHRKVGLTAWETLEVE